MDELDVRGCPTWHNMEGKVQPIEEPLETFRKMGASANALKLLCPVCMSGW